MTEEKQKIANRIAEIISEARMHKNYSRYELSKRTGIHTSQIIRIERGENIPRVDTLMKIFEELSLQVRITQPDLIYIYK